MRYLASFFLYVFCGLTFGREWLSLEGKNLTFWLDTYSSTFTLTSPQSNYLHSEGKNYPPTSLFFVCLENDIQILSPQNRGIIQTKPWQKTNHILWSQFSWNGVLYTPAIFLTNNREVSFFLLSIHVSNTSQEAKKVGFRFLLDTTFEENKNTPLFWFQNGASISNETEISLNVYGHYILSGDGKTGLFLLPSYNGLLPKNIYLGNYHRLKTSRTTITIQPSANFTYDMQSKRDGAIMVTYEHRLRSGETLEGGIALSETPLLPLGWNATLFDFLSSPSQKVTTPHQAPPIHTSPLSTNVVFITNTISIAKDNTNSLALQSLINKLEYLIQTISNLNTPVTIISSPPSSPKETQHSRPSSSWFPTEDPFADKYSSSSQKTAPKTNVSHSSSTSPPLTIRPQETPQKETTLPLSIETPSSRVIFVTNIITNYVILTNTSSSFSQPDPSLLSLYESKIQTLQTQLIELQKGTSLTKKLALIEKRLELLNWLLERSHLINLSPEDIAKMNSELDDLLYSLERKKTP